jgi:D-alanine-D-alanine ligase
MNRLKVGLLYGGYSNEADVSRHSGHEVSQQLDKNRFDVYPIEVTKGKWYYNNFDDNRITVDLNDFSVIINNQVRKMDVCFIALHGTPGEDGKVQSYLDIVGVPYTSVSAIESAVTFNKRYTIAIASHYGIHTAKHLFFLKSEAVDTESVAHTLKLPLFVKPCKSGSSVGVSRVERWEDLNEAVSKAFAEDEEIMLEEQVEGREFSTAICTLNGKTFIGPFIEAVGKKIFDCYDHSAKNIVFHDPGEVSASITSDEARLVEEFLKSLYRIFTSKGILRVDYIISDTDGKPILLEANTIPGMSKYSRFPKMITAAGGTLTDFYGQLIEDAYSDSK